LVVISDPIFYVPNSFTPDQDENNQTWHPVFTTGFDPYKFSLVIYNRWGEIIWESLNAEGEWDGTYGVNGLDVPLGVYTWVINYSNKETDDKKVITGNINLIR
jgi:gliding motility-associated-like protein